MQTNSLGRGLEALIPKKTIQDTVAKNSGIQKIPVGNIVPNPHQPRHDFDEEALAELADSIKTHGILQPLVVTSVGEGKYELVAGERRLQASKKIGLESVPAIVRSAGEQQKLELALVENVQRHNLNAIEEAEAFVRLIEEFGLTQEQTAQKVSKSREYIANTVRLLALSDNVKEAIRHNKITRGHAKAMLALEKKEDQDELLKKIVGEGLTVRDVERTSREKKGITTPRKTKKDPEILGLEEELRGIFGTRVTIKGGRKNGELVIDYYSSEEFDSLIKKLLGNRNDFTI